MSEWLTSVAVPRADVALDKKNKQTKKNPLYSLILKRILLLKPLLRNKTLIFNISCSETQVGDPADSLHTLRADTLSAHSDEMLL